MRITSRAGLAVLGFAAATSASGYVLTEIQDAEGNAIPGFALDDFSDTGGDEIARKVEWKNQHSDLSSLAGKTIRLRFVMKDADRYAIQFTRFHRNE